MCRLQSNAPGDVVRGPARLASLAFRLRAKCKTAMRFCHQPAYEISGLRSGKGDGPSAARFGRGTTRNQNENWPKAKFTAASTNAGVYEPVALMTNPVQRVVRMPAMLPMK